MKFKFRCLQKFKRIKEINSKELFKEIQIIYRNSPITQCPKSIVMYYITSQNLILSRFFILCMQVYMYIYIYICVCVCV